jgi:hypothetical protein
MSQHGSSTTAPSTAARTTPWTVNVLSAVVALLALVTSYGAIYFSFYFENPDPGLGSWVFVIVFLAINVVAAVSAVGLVRGSRLAFQVLAGYGVLGILWCIAKLVFWHEPEAVVFGAFNILALVLLAAPRTRRFVG